MDAGVADRASKELARILPPGGPAPSVIDTERGTTLFVWHTAGWDLHLEVGSESSEVWARPCGQSTLLLGPLDEHETAMRAILESERGGSWMLARH